MQHSINIDSFRLLKNRSNLYQVSLCVLRSPARWTSRSCRKEHGKPHNLATFRPTRLLSHLFLPTASTSLLLTRILTLLNISILGFALLIAEIVSFGRRAFLFCFMAPGIRCSLPLTFNFALPNISILRQGPVHIRKIREIGLSPLESLLDMEGGRAKVIGSSGAVLDVRGAAIITLVVYTQIV